MAASRRHSLQSAFDQAVVKLACANLGEEDTPVLTCGADVDASKLVLAVPWSDRWGMGHQFVRRERSATLPGKPYATPWVLLAEEVVLSVTAASISPEDVKGMAWTLVKLGLDG